MTLSEFTSSYEDLTDAALLKKWKSLLAVLEKLSADEVKHLIQEGALDTMEYEEDNDFFGTEGMKI